MMLLYALRDRSQPLNLCAVMLTSAEHDQVWVGAHPEAVNGVATDEQLITLMRCGLSYDEHEDGFFFYV